MLKKLSKIIKEHGCSGLLLLVIRIFLHKVFHIRLVGGLSIASVSKEKKIFSNRNLKYSDDGYFFVDPMPSIDELNDYYSSFYWEPNKKAKKIHGANSRDFLHYNLLKEYIPQELSHGKVFLNFGAGHGGISHLCWLNGMIVVNVEPSLLPKFYEERWDSYADISEIEDDSIDLIYGSHSLEHVQDIEKIKEEFRRVLKPNGLLFWEVPNADNEDNGSQHGRIDIPHTYYFKVDFFKKWFSEVLLCDAFDQISWKESNTIENWSEYKDKNGRVIRALGRID